MQAFRARAPLASVTMTVQAPQSPSLQPSFVPFNPRASRSQSSNVTVGAAVTRTGVPFNRNATSAMIYPATFCQIPAPRCGVKGLASLEPRRATFRKPGPSVTLGP